MGYRKFTAHQLFTGSRLLTGQVLVTDEHGKVEAIIPAEAAGQDVQVFPGILSPGFINAHCHLELSHLKGVIPPQTGMIDFLLGVMGRRADPAVQRMEAIAAAETAMYENGIVAVGDICNTADTLDRKQQARLYYHSFIEATGFIDATAEDRLRAAQTVADKFRNVIMPGKGNLSLVPHAPYSVSQALFQRLTGIRNNRLLTMHNQESVEEEAFFRAGTGGFLRLYQALGIDISFYRPPGKSSLQAIAPCFGPAQSVILVHNVTTSEEDLTFMRTRDQQESRATFYYCLCPNANRYIGNGLPDVRLLRHYQVPLVIGTDSLASNYELNILAEIKTLQVHFPEIPLPELLQWATRNGAEALDIAQQYGSFETGRQPGVILLEPGLSGVRRLL